MKDYGKKLADFIFMKYEEMGMDTEEKRQEYASLVMNCVNLVYGSYARAKDGGERRSLREMINQQYTHQTQGMGMGTPTWAKNSQCPGKRSPRQGLATIPSVPLSCTMERYSPKAAILASWNTTQRPMERWWRSANSSGRGPISHQSPVNIGLIFLLLLIDYSPKYYSHTYSPFERILSL